MSFVTEDNMNDESQYKELPKNKSKLTILDKFPDRKYVFMEATKNGMPLRMACDLAKISYETIRRYIRLYEVEGNEDYRDLVEDYYHAQAVDVNKCLTTINNARDSGDLKAAFWRLEKCYSRHFGLESAIKALAEEMDQIQRLNKLERKSYEKRIKQKSDKSGNEESDQEI